MINNTEYKICRRCIMDTSDPDISFDETGLCNHCTGYYERVEAELPYPEAAPAELERVISRIKEKGRGREYDCVLGLSGGVDSTYVAWLAKQHGLRALAVHFDNGWNSELAVDNIKRIVEKLGFDFYTHVVDWEEFKDVQLSFLRASVPNCEIPTDHAINALLYDIANKHGVCYILGGGNVRTEGILPSSWGYTNQDLRHLKAVHKRHGRRKLRTLPTISLLKSAYLIALKRIRMVPILNLACYEKSRAMDVIHRELGWRKYGAKHYESIFTRFFQGYLLPKKFGFDKRRAHLSCLVCAREMSRDEALKVMERDPYEGYSVEEDLQFVRKKFGLTSEEFERILLMPPVAHSEYASNSWFFTGMKGMKSRLKRFATRV